MSFIRPFNSQAVESADNEFYENHPEMVKNGVRQPIDATDPEQESIRNEWKQNYVANGGEKTENEPSKSPGESNTNSAVQTCPLSPDQKAEPKPTIEAKWSKEKILPVHNSDWPPATPPTDTVPERSKVSLIITTTLIPDESSASVEIFHCHTSVAVKNGALHNLIVRNNSVIDLETGNAPIWVFESQHELWDPWDKPFYYFKAETGGLVAETSKDFKLNKKETLQLEYLHVCVGDAMADAHPVNPLSTVQEMNEIADILKYFPADGNSNHYIYTNAFNNENLPLNLLGSVLRNCYSYHHASHGSIVDFITGHQMASGAGPGTPVGNWNSVVALCGWPFRDKHINNSGDVPSTPKYLAYLNTCLAGWEPSLANAFISRGTKYVIAFRDIIPDKHARAMARKFYKKWRGQYNCDPEKIPDIFALYEPVYRESMRPVLYGGVPVSSGMSFAADRINDLISGWGS